MLTKISTEITKILHKILYVIRSEFQYDNPLKPKCSGVLNKMRGAQGAYAN